MAHLNTADSPTKLCLDIISGDTVDIEMKEIGRRHFPFRDVSNQHFLPVFSFAYIFLASTESSDFISNAPIYSLYNSILM